MGFGHFGAPTKQQLAHYVECLYRDKERFDRKEGRFYFHVEQRNDYLRRLNGAEDSSTQNTLG